MEIGFDTGEMSVRPSVCLYTHSKISSNRPIFKILLCGKGMKSKTYHLYFLPVSPSVRAYGWTDRQNR